MTPAAIILAVAQALQPGELVSYSPLGGDVWCMRVTSTAPHVADLPYAWLTDTRDTRRVMHVDVRELARGCK